MLSEIIIPALFCLIISEIPTLLEQITGVPANKLSTIETPKLSPWEGKIVYFAFRIAPHFISSFKKFKKIVTIEEGVIDGGFGEGILNWSAKNNFSKDILTLGVPNRFVDHGPRDVLLEEIGLDSVTLYENIFNFIKKIND